MPTPSEITQIIDSLDSEAITSLIKDTATNLQPTATTLKTVLSDKKSGASKGLSFLDAVQKQSESVSESGSEKSNYFFSLLVIETYQNILPHAAEAKTGSQTAKILKSAIKALETTTDSTDSSSESDSPLLSCFLPQILNTISKPPQNKWKLKLAALDAFVDCDLLIHMQSQAPKILQKYLPEIVNVLVECSKEVRSEIKNASSKLLEQVGLLVKCNEIKNVSDKLVGCLKNFGNMKLASEVLYAIANTTFLSYVDSASFALLFPIVERAIKERDFTAKKNGLMIIGAAVVLIENPEILNTYLVRLLPLLQSLTVDPVFELRREATKSLGSLCKFLPDLAEDTILPWCLRKLEAKGVQAIDKNTNTTSKVSEIDHDSGNDRTGASTAIMEIILQTKDKTLLDRLVMRVIKGRCLDHSKTSSERQAGAYELIEMLCKTDQFESLACTTCINWILMGLRSTNSELVISHAMSAGKSLILNYGGNNCDRLVSPIADAILSFDKKSEKSLCLTLLRDLIEKVAEYRNYGTDLWTMAEGVNVTKITKIRFMTLLQMTRVDEDAEMRRISNKTLNEQVGSLVKVKKETLKDLMSTVKYIMNKFDNSSNSDNSCSTSKSRYLLAKRCLSDLQENAKDNGFKQEDYDSITLSESESSDCINIMIFYNWKDLSNLSEDEKKYATYRLHVHREDEEDSDDEDEAHHDKPVEWKDLEGLSLATFSKYDELNTNELGMNIIINAVLESLTVKKAVEKIKNSTYFSEDKFTEFQSLLENSIYKNYHPKELKVLQNPEEILCHVENLMLMYGGGHMLLKDTTFELRKGKRYGVVGRNGTGKTTLMNLIASNGVPGIPKEMTCTHVKPEVLDNHMNTKCFKFMELENPSKSDSKNLKVLEEILRKVEFPEHLWEVTVGELSGGWRMRLLIASAMMKKSDVLLLDEPTNHLDTKAVTWLSDYLVSLDQSAIMVISHDPGFLNRVCTNIINYNSGKLVYYDGNFDAFTSKLGINSSDAEALLAGQVAVSEKGVERGGLPTSNSTNSMTNTMTNNNNMKKAESCQSMTSMNNDTLSTIAGTGVNSQENTPRKMSNDNTLPTSNSTTNIESLNRSMSEVTNSTATGTGTAALTPTTKEGDSDVNRLRAESELSVASSTPTPAGTGGGPDRKAKIVFPIAGKVKGLTSLAKPVLEINNLTYAYNEKNGDVIKGVSAKITMNSRIHIKGVNGAGKTTFMNLICGEVHPNASACDQKGSVVRHRNCRLAYMAQQHMHHMSEFMETSPYIYIQKRYANGYDGALQHRLLTPATEEEAEERKAKAKRYGKYGCTLKNLVGRQMRGKELYYEAQWEGLDDTSKNTWINMNDLRNLGCESYALAYDDRAAAIDGGVADRPLSQREIVKHLEQFGITEELALNRNIGMFSAGQKSKVSLAAAFWIKPHLVALDEPTNYIDMETLDSLTIALQRFKGGVICISHCADFVSKVCTESWHMEAGGLTITKLKDGGK